MGVGADAMEKRSDRYVSENGEQQVTKSRVAKNTVLYDEINSKRP